MSEKEPTPHNWQVEEVPVPNERFPKGYWVCKRCGASAGPTGFRADENLEIRHPSVPAFLAGTPLQPVADNCYEAKKQIDAFLERCPDWKEHVDRARGLERTAGIEPA